MLGSVGQFVEIPLLTKEIPARTWQLLPESILLSKGAFLVKKNQYWDPNVITSFILV